MLNARIKRRDTAGQERFNNITESYYRTAKGVMFVYDITNGESFDNVAKWLRNLEQVGNYLNGFFLVTFL